MCPAAVAKTIEDGHFFSGVMTYANRFYHGVRPTIRGTPSVAGAYRVGGGGGGVLGK